MSEEKSCEFLNSYLGASFGEAATAYDGLNGVSCVKGIIERIYSGLKVVDSKIAGILKELEGVRLFKEWIAHPKNFLHIAEGKQFTSFSKMMFFLNDHILEVAEKDYSLKSTKSYAINAPFPELDSFLPLKEEITQRLFSENYQDFLQEAYLNNGYHKKLRQRSKSL